MPGTAARHPNDGSPAARRRRFAFWLGSGLTVVGVALHLPMYFEAADMHYRLVGMPMSTGMTVGMIAIIVGLALSGYGLLPRRADFGKVAGLKVQAVDDAPIGSVHVRMLLVLAVAVTIDVMKPTTLAFIAPGVTEEYGLKSALNPGGSVPEALLPLFGITGTVLGSILWGWLGDRMGRQAAMLYAGIIFVATSICGAMPSFTLNLVMCFLMGLGAGGMLPVSFTLLSETIPARHRGWLMVLIGGDVAGGYAITSWLSETLIPTYSWRVMWLLGLPTGVLLILLTRWVPESPRYLLAVGREHAARAVLARYHAEIKRVDRSELTVESGISSRYRQLLRPPFLGMTAVVGLVAVGIGLEKYGFQLWLPTNLRSLGYDGAVADQMLRNAALIGLPFSVLIAYLYHRSTRWTLIGLSLVTTASLLGFVIAGDSVASNHAALYALLVMPIWGASSITAVLSAYAVEVYPTRIRSRASGFSAAMTKAGGVLIIALVVAAVAAPSLRITALLGAIPIAAAAILAFVVTVETRRRRLEDITAAELQLADISR